MSVLASALLIVIAWVLVFAVVQLTKRSMYLVA